MGLKVCWYNIRVFLKKTANNFNDKRPKIVFNQTIYATTIKIEWSTILKITLRKVSTVVAGCCE